MISKIIQGRHAHKKMALLVAIYQCCIGIEEMFFRALGDRELNYLLNVNDGLRKLTDIIKYA